MALANLTEAARLGFQSGEEQGKTTVNPLGQFVRNMLATMQQKQAMEAEYGMKKGLAQTEMASKFALEKYKTELEPPEYKPKTFEEKVNLEREINKAKGKNVTDISDLPSQNQIQIRALSRKLYGVRGAEYGMPAIAEEVRKGKTIDQVEDELRYAGQSKEFVGPVRNAAQSILMSANPIVAQTGMDYIDDLTSQGDIEGTKQALKRLSMKNATADQQNQFVGKERTLEFLDEIQQDLDTLERNGESTGWISGNVENLMARVGQVKSPAMREIATKLAVNIMNYRRSMTGVNFGMQENKEYYRVFPNINKVGAFNKASINGLKSAFKGDLDNFYSMSMGKENYKKLFGEETEKSEVSTQDEDLISKYMQKYPDRSRDDIIKALQKQRK